MSTGKTYSTKYLLDSNNNRGAEGQVLSTTSTGIDWVDANTVPGTGLWLANGNNIYNSNSGNVGIGTTSPAFKLDIDGTLGVSDLPFNTTSVSVLVANETIGAELLPQPLDLSTDFAANTTATTINDSDTFTVSSGGTFNGITLKTWLNITK